MALVVKCDVCGEVYQPKNVDTDKTIPSGYNAIALIDKDHVDGEWNGYLEVDCCPECMQNIIYHMEVRGFNLKRHALDRKEDV